MARQIESLEQLLRDKATERLRAEVQKAFRGLLKYFAGSSETSDMEVTTNFTIQVKDPDLRGGVERTYVVRVDSLWPLLEGKAVENLSVKRGNEAVEAFLNRVEEISSQLDELRSTVDNHLNE